MTPQGSEPWKPNGFPPPSFVVETERTGTFVGPRGRWLAAAAILGAVLLIAGIVLIANQGDDNNTALNTGSSTTAVGDTSPTFPSTTALDPTATLPNATVPPGGDPGITAPGATATTAGPVTTAAPGPTAAPGVLTPTRSSVPIARIDASVGNGEGTDTVGLKNTGASPLTFKARSNVGALTANPSDGTIAPNETAVVTVKVEGKKAAEGTLNGELRFESNGTSKLVTVTTTVGRPPTITDTVDASTQCPTESSTNPTACSKQIKPTSNAVGASPCTGPWRYRVVISDESNLKAVRADRDADVELKGTNNAANGPQGTWQSDEQAALQPGTTLIFTIEAIDQFDFPRRSTERRVKCP